MFSHEIDLICRMDDGLPKGDSSHGTARSAKALEWAVHCKTLPIILHFSTRRSVLAPLSPRDKIKTTLKYHK